MIDMIGVLVGAAILFVLSLVAGLVYAGVAFLILWKRPRHRIPLVLLAAAIPVCSTAYMWVCVALLPGESLFGDINQPLPNGYILKAIGKMPQYGNIERKNGDLSSDGVNGVVDMVAVNGPLVAGRYCQSCDPAFVQTKALYFVLDTRIAKTSEYANLPTLQATLGSTVALVENQYFRSNEPYYLRQQRLKQFLLFTPPALLTGILLALLMVIRRSQQAITT